MFNTKTPYKISYRLLFVLGALLGAIFFIGIYGARILDFTNTGWLFYGDNDLRQHYIAWCVFRNDPWHFPIGLIDSLSYPHSVSVVYTDSIPLFAIIFKTIRGVLPVTFQYFGLFGIMSYMLMGGLAAILLARFIEDPIICLIGACFYITSFQVLQRMYYHTALGAQWIIILAMILWVYDSKIVSAVRKCLCWAFMGFLCVTIHSYYLPMVGMILAALMLCQFALGYEKNSGVKGVINALTIPICELGSFSIVGLIFLYIIGGFYGGTSGYGGGLGTFGSNLNTFVNPIDYGRLMPRLPLFYDFQYEGFGYLGCGIFMLYFSVAAGLLFRAARKTPEKNFHSNKIYGISTIIVVVVSILSSSLPLLSFGDKKIIMIPYPHFVESILGIFRSNGRLIWVATYVLITVAICIAAYTFRHYRAVAILLISCALVLQMLDASNMYRDKHRYFTADYMIMTPWDDPELTPLTEDKKEFIFLYTNNDLTLLSAYYGYLNGMRQNNYYYARDIDDDIRETITGYMDELRNGIVRDESVYIITKEMFDENPGLYQNLPVRMIDKYDHVFFAR